jgi:hypothetical protein
MSELPELRELVGQVVLEGIGGPRDPLAQLASAERMAADLAGLGDRLIGYFVQQARAEGYSWADIGAHKGFSRQAAQQRYAPYVAWLTLAELTAAGALASFGPQAIKRLHDAEAYARGADALSTTHLLLAILDDTNSVAVETLTALGASPAALRAALRLTRDPAAGTGAILLADDARRALEGAAAEAQAAGHEVATAHLLLGILRNPGSPAGKLLASHGVTRAAAAQQLRDRLSRYLQGSD